MRFFRQKYTVKGETRQAKTWSIEFRDHTYTLRTLASGTPNERIARDIGRRVEELVEHAAMSKGLTRASAAHLSAMPESVVTKLMQWHIVPPEHGAAITPLAEHLKSFYDHMIASGASRDYSKLKAGRATTLVEEAGYRTYRDLCTLEAAERLTATLSRLRQGPMSDQTAAHYMAAIRAFCRYMQEHKNMPEASIWTVRQRGRIRRAHDRRALSVDEFERLIRVTASGPSRGNHTGAEWALIYWLSAMTGMDRKTLNILTPQHIRFMDGVAVISVRRPKNDAPLTPWLTDPALVGALRERCERTLPNTRLFALNNHTARVLRYYLDLAGIAYKDGANRAFDFHAIRTQFSSVAQDNDIPAKSVQKALGHADISTTLNHYTDPTDKQLKKLADSMPRLRLTDESDAQTA